MFPRILVARRIELTGLRPRSRNDSYELWLLGENGEQVSLASLRVPPT